MKALVLGGSGFLGLNLVDALRAEGHEVRATVRKRSVTLLLRQRGVELFPAALDDTEGLIAAMRGRDAVFHSAGHYPKYSLDREGSVARARAEMRSVCDAAIAAKVPRLVYTSSVGSLGAAPGGREAHEGDLAASAPECTYRAVKWSMERELERAAERGLSAVTLLPGGCIGPWDLRLGTGAIFVATVRGQLPWWVDGVVNLVDVRDVARAHVVAARADPGARYIVGGENLRVSQLLRRLVARYGGAYPTAPIAPEEARQRADADERAAARTGARAPFPRELVDLITTGQPVSSDLARRALGLRFTPLDEALDGAYAWFVSFKFIKKNETQRTHEQS